jgi:hypothetical protein
MGDEMMWEQLDAKTASLKSVYEPLLNRAEQFSRPWSIAEARLSPNDIEWLRTWFAYLRPEIVENWVRSILRVSVGPENVASCGEMLGGVFLCIASEVCREESREDSVWPT